MRDLKIKTPESMKEYNEVFLDRIHNAKLLFNSLPHALSKSGASDVCLKVGGEFRTVYDEAMRQLRIIGWGQEMKQTIQDALVVYRQYLLDKLYASPGAAKGKAAGDGKFQELVALIDQKDRSNNFTAWAEWDSVNAMVNQVYGINIGDALEAWEKQNTPQETAEWVETEENDYVPHCSACGGAADIDGYEATVRGKIRYVSAEKCPTCGRRMTNAN